MEIKTIETVIENLKDIGYKPNSIKHIKEDSRVKYDMLEMYIQPDVIQFQIRLGFNTGNLPVTFDKAEAEYLENKGIDDWSIYKYWLEFSYSPSNEEDFENFLRELLKRYE